MAELLTLGKEESARIRVESIVREDIYIELLEMIELYCELLLARIALLDRKVCDPGLEEAVKTIIFAAPHCDIKELLTIRDLLAHKFGAEFTNSAVENEDGIVPEKITKRTSVEAPSQELVSLYLQEIAKAYNAPFSELDEDKIGFSDSDREKEEEEEEKDDDDDDDDDDDEGTNFNKPIELEEQIEEAKRPISRPRKLSEVNLTDIQEGEMSSIRIRPPHKTIDSLRPSVKISSDIAKNVKKKINSDTTKPKSKEKDDLDNLRKRFEALKR